MCVKCNIKELCSLHALWFGTILWLPPLLPMTQNSTDANKDVFFNVAAWTLKILLCAWLLSWTSDSTTLGVCFAWLMSCRCAVRLHTHNTVASSHLSIELSWLLLASASWLSRKRRFALRWFSVLTKAFRLSCCSVYGLHTPTDRSGMQHKPQMIAPEAATAAVLHHVHQAIVSVLVAVQGKRAVLEQWLKKAARPRVRQGSKSRHCRKSRSWRSQCALHKDFVFGWHDFNTFIAFQRTIHLFLLLQVSLFWNGHRSWKQFRPIANREWAHFLMPALRSRRRLWLHLYPFFDFQPHFKAHFSQSNSSVQREQRSVCDSKPLFLCCSQSLCLTALVSDAYVLRTVCAFKSRRVERRCVTENWSLLPKHHNLWCKKTSGGVSNSKPLLLKIQARGATQSLCKKSSQW